MQEKLRPFSFAIISSSSRQLNFATMIILEKNMREISNTCSKGVCHAKDYNLAKHLEIDVPNLQCLIVQDGLKTINQSVANIRSLVTIFHTSPTKYQVFLTCCQNIGLKLINVPLNVKTRWNSTYKMLEVATKYKAALGLFQTKIKHQPFLIDEDWDIASLWREHLVQFYGSTEIIYGSHYPTILLVLKEITKIKDICLEIENNDLFQ
ncbi:hypothetical protein PRUPE_1G534800 [Prunus persica]|uniref:hAT-like transposase RNase-H fold domain-containing protein n=1 Tax=Prunus persica TaxID=3760 RepID=A0A251RHH1_PRUPE|nr:hypothetical protein PRUPE_1G534800 [Prunus persica]